MKNVILMDEFHQSDFKTAQLFQQFMKLTEKDVSEFLLNSEKLVNCSCPACHVSEVASSFSKFGMSYLECAECGTLRISPRPNDQALLRYYEKSSAEQYWQHKLSKKTEEKRKRKIIQPRCQWIADATQEYLNSPQHIVDIYTNQEGFAAEFSNISIFKEKTLIHPFLSSQEITPYPKLNVIPQPFPEVTIEQIDVITVFEVVNRTSDVEKLFATIHNMLKKNGLCFMTTILASGLDLQILGEKAENLFPPDWLNVFSVEGIKLLFERHGFECLEFSTPGLLDIEHIVKAVEKDPDIKIPKFLAYMLKYRDENTLHAFQAFLQANLLSSYGRFLLRKL